MFLIIIIRSQTVITEYQGSLFVHAVATMCQGGTDLVDDDLNVDMIINDDIYSQLERHADGDYLRMAI